MDALVCACASVGVESLRLVLSGHYPSKSSKSVWYDDSCGSKLYEWCFIQHTGSPLPDIIH